ncbi:MAG: SocA family protein [Spirochaetales bacterium]|nr:SocA family protein [Spirochaetales bacterium]
MKLQKLIYFCQGFHLAFFDSPLFDEDIQAWSHGPVCPSLYHRFRKFESNPVILIDADNANLADREKHLIDDVYRLYGQYTDRNCET